MIYFLIAFCIVLFLGGYFFSKGNIFSPATITNGIWLICLSLFLLLNHNLPPLSGKFCEALALWTGMQFLGTMCSQSIKFKKSELKANEDIRDLFLLISAICFPFLLFWAGKALAVGTTGNWALDLRNAAIGQSSLGDEAYGSMYFLLWQATYLVELIYFEKKRWWRTVLPALFILSFGFLTMSKTVFLAFFTMSICILFFKKKISLAQIGFGVIILLVSIMLLHSARHHNLNSERQKNDFVVLYALSSMTAFDCAVEPNSSTHPGENVFRIYYAIMYKLGLSDIEPINPILKFIKKPIVTNTYTGMYPFYKDFGLTGVSIFGFILGILFGYIFRRAQCNNVLFLIIYAYLSYMILMQYVGDFFFTNLSGTIKFIILTYILFLPKRNDKSISE